MRERDLIERLLKPLASDPAARGLGDDAAVLTPPLGRDLVFTHDTLAADVHFLAGDPPSDIAWKLLATNLSDLAAMGASPIGALLSLGLSAAEDDTWLAAFTDGLRRGLERWNVALLGGDTVRGLAQAVLGLTAIGQVEPGRALSRNGAQPGDGVYVTGTVGDAGLGLAIAKGEAEPDKFLLNRYRRPEPRLGYGQMLGGVASAAMDVSDGLLIDAEQLSKASGMAITLDLGAVPLSGAAAARTARSDADLLDRVAAGDDYELLFTCAGEPPADPKLRVTRVGTVATGSGLTVLGLAGEPVTPARLGWEHG